ncbi:MAG: amidohydrolase family protein [Ferruginibacter sp.]
MYRKYKPTHIFNGTQLLPEGQVLICLEDGTIEQVLPLAEAGDDVQEIAGILSPGFINAHCHTELSHFKRMIPEHTGLVNFVQQVMSRRNEKPAAEKQSAMEAAVQEMYDSGIVAVGDICNTTDSIPVKQNGLLYWQNFIEVSGFVDAGANKRWNDIQLILEEFRTALPSSSSIPVPHAPYSVSRTLFELINSATAGQLISIHNQETAAENELYQHKSGDFLTLYKNFGIDISSFVPTGRSSLQSWLPYFDSLQQIISVHNSFTGEADIAFAKNRLSYCICINANLYIENVLPPVELLLKNGCHIVLGTDSYASNHQLSIMAEINSIQKSFPGIAIETMLQWATINGAKTLGIDDRYGSFEPGKKPGLVLINNGEAKRWL